MIKSLLAYVVAGAVTVTTTIVGSKLGSPEVGAVAGTAVGGFLMRLFHLASPPKAP